MNLSSKESLKEFCNKHINPYIIIRDKEEIFNKKLWIKAADHSLHSLFIADYKNYVDQFNYFETFCYHSKDNGLSFSIAAQLFSCTIPLYLFGNDAQKQKYLALIQSGKFICANAITEERSGSDVFSMEGSFEKSEKLYHLKAHKKYCTLAPVTDLVLVYLRSNEVKKAIGNISAFVLEKKLKQFTIHDEYHKLGLRTTPMADILMNTKVKHDQLLKGEGAGNVIFQNSMIWERIGMSFMHTGISRRLLDEIKIYCKNRMSFGKSLASYQSIYHKLAELETEWQASTNLNEYAATLLEKKSKNTMTLASMCKYKSSTILKQIAEYTLHLQGASGYSKSNDWERTYRDAAASDLYSGTSEMQKEIIASALQIKSHA